MRKRSRLWRAAGAGVALGVLLGGLYAYLTRPAMLRAGLVRVLEHCGLRVVDLGGISFSPWGGLRLSDLEVAAGEAGPRGAGRSAAPPLHITVPQAAVSLRLLPLLAGRVEARQLRLQNPTVALRWPAAGAERFWRCGSSAASSLGRDALSRMPRVELRAADLRVFLAESGRERLLGRWMVDGRGWTARADEAGRTRYALELFQVAGPASGRQRRGASLAGLRWDGAELCAQLGWVDLKLVRALLPEYWRQRLRTLRLDGQSRVVRLVWADGGVRQAELELAELSFRLPVEAARQPGADELSLQVTEATGRLAFSRPAAGVRGPGAAELHLTGRLDGAAATLDLKLHDIVRRSASRPDAAPDGQGRGGLALGGYELNLDVRGFDLPNAAQRPRWLSLGRLPRPVKTFLRDYDMQGRINLRLNLARRGDGGAVRYGGEVEVLDGSCCYRRFPYPVVDVRGRARFSNNGVWLEGLHARHGCGSVRLDGRLTDTSSWTGFELRFAARSVASDEALYRALPSRYRQLWEAATPLALCDADVVVRREHGTPETGARPTEVALTARVLAGSLGLRPGQRLEGANGRLRIAGGVIEFEDLHGYLDEADASVSGTINFPGEDASPEYNVRVEVGGARFAQLSPVRDGAGETLGTVRFEGVGDVWGQVSSAEPAQDHFAARVRDGRLTGFDAGTPWTGVRGWFCLAGDRRLLSLSAAGLPGRLTVSGTLPRRVDAGEPLELELRSTDAQLDALLRQLVPERWSGIREALGLGGRGSLAARLTRVVGGPEPNRQAAEVELSAERMRPGPLPIDLRDLEAHVTLRSDGFEVRQATASCGQSGRVALRGRGGWEDGRVWSELRVTARDLQLERELLDALPADLADLLGRLAPRGRLDLWLEPIRLNAGPRRSWSLAGRLRLKDAALSLGLPLNDFDGRVDGTCTVDSTGRVSAAADFTIDHGRLASRPISRWQGRVVRRPDSSRLWLEDVRGGLCGGEVSGFATLDPASSSYELSFSLRDVSLAELLQRSGRRNGRAVRGRLDGHIFLRGTANDPTRRSGGGELRIRGSTLFSSPITASLLEASRRDAREISDEVQQAELHFAWEANELNFTRVDIQSRDLRLIGVGRWNLRSDAIEMTLVGATPEHLPRLFLLTDLLETAGQELVQYRIGGTASKPQVTVEPLHNLTGPLRELLRLLREER